MAAERARVRRADYANYLLVTLHRARFAVFPLAYRSFSYSALASFRMGMSGSASFQRVRKSL